MTARAYRITLLSVVAILLGTAAYVLQAQLAPLCGNQRIDKGEQCDDGNSSDTDGCSRQCTRSIPQDVRELLPYDSYFSDAWKEQMIHSRGSLTTQTGLRYDQASKRWLPQPNASGTGDIAHGAYNITYVTETAVNVAEATNDQELIDDLAQFYIDYFHKRFTTIGTLRADVRAKPRTLTGVLLHMNPDGTLRSGADPDNTKTLGWYEPISHTSVKYRVRECKLCMMQFFISPARLIRVIATIPTSKRTPLMTQFATTYAPMMINDHLLRYDAWLKGQWERPPQERQIGDTDMMHMSAIADMLGAHIQDPTLVVINDQTERRLKDLLIAGVNAVKIRSNSYPNTKDWKGNTVGSMDLFEGDYDTYSDYRFSNYSGPIPPYPTPPTLTPPVMAGYDVSHAWRFPQTLRSMYDNKDLLGLPFPTEEDLRLLANQYTYKVFKGDLEKPQLNNFMDGRDTWYRVGYGTGYVGLAPTQYCYNFDREFKDGTHAEDRARKYPCLVGLNARIAWGRLAGFQKDLNALAVATVDLLRATEPDRIAFRERYLSYGNNEPFQFWDNGLHSTPNAEPWFMLLPFALLSDLSIPVSTDTTPVHPAAETVINLPQDTHVLPSCRTAAFTADAAACINALIHNRSTKAPLTLNLKPGTYTLRTQTIVLMNTKNITIKGGGLKREDTVITMDASASRKNGDMYFMIQTFNSSNIKISNLTLDGGELSGQRGIGVCSLPFATTRNITVSNIMIKNMALYGMIAGNIYSEGLQNPPAIGGSAALTALFSYLRSIPQEQRYCSGNISGITFENNWVDVGTPAVVAKGMGFVIAPYASKQPLSDRNVSHANWSSVARSLARRNSDITVKGNAFRGWSHEADSGIRLHNASNILITGNTFTDAGYTKGFSSGGEVFIGQNVWNATVTNNRFYLTPKTVDPARGVVVAKGFDQQNLYGYGKNLGLTSPSFHVTIEKNAFYNAKIRLMDCCLASNTAVSAYCTNNTALNGTAEDSMIIRNNTNVSSITDPSLIWQNSVKEAGRSWTAVCRPDLPIISE